jgi:hypothetical protein
MLGFNVPKKIINLILRNNWPINNADAKDDPYEPPIVTYNKEMD